MIQYGYDFNEISIYFIIDTDLIRLHYPNLPIIANVAGFSNEEYAFVAGKISQAPNVKAIILHCHDPH